MVDARTVNFDYEAHAYFARQFDPAYPSSRVRETNRSGSQSFNSDHNNYSVLPRIAKLDISLDEPVQSPVSDRNVVLLNTRRTVKCIARPLIWNSENRLYVYAGPQRLLIPMNFSGWFCYLEEYHDNSVKKCSTVSELVDSKVSAFVIAQSCSCLTSTKASKHHQGDGYVTDTLDVGEVLYVERVYVQETRKRPFLLCHKADPAVYYLQCKGMQGHSVLLDFRLTGSFFALRADSSHTSGGAFLLSDIIDHVTSAAPIRVKLITAEANCSDSASSSDVSAFELIDVLCENVILACGLTDKRLFEIPVSCSVKIYLVKQNVDNDAEIRGVQKDIMDKCVSNEFIFLNAIKMSYAEFWDRIDEVNKRNDERLTAKKELGVAPAAERSSSTLHSLNPADSDDYATLPDMRPKSLLKREFSEEVMREIETLKWKMTIMNVKLESEEGYLIPFEQNTAAVSLPSDNVDVSVASIHQQVNLEDEKTAMNGASLSPSVEKSASLASLCDRPAAPLPRGKQAAVVSSSSESHISQLPYKHLYSKRRANQFAVEEVEYVNDIMDVAQEGRSSGRSIQHSLRGLERTGSGRSATALSVSSEYQIISQVELMQKLSDKLDNCLRDEMLRPIRDKRQFGTNSVLGLTADGSVDSGFTASSLSLCHDGLMGDWNVEKGGAMPPMLPQKEMQELSVEEVCAALMQIGISAEVAGKFLVEHIDGQQLREMTDELLKDAFPSLNKLHRKKILDFASGWRPRRWKSSDYLCNASNDQLV